MTNELTQDIFNGQPEKVDWAGVDYDGNLNFGIAGPNVRYPWLSERYRGYEKVGDTIKNSGFKPETSIRRKK